jgi:hypothetical protein
MGRSWMETSASSHNFAVVSHQDRVDQTRDVDMDSPSKDIFYICFKFALAKGFDFCLLCLIIKSQNAMCQGHVVLHVYSLSSPAAHRFNRRRGCMGMPRVLNLVLPLRDAKEFLLHVFINEGLR